MSLGALLSALFHGAIVLIAIFGLPHFVEPPEFEPPIPVEVIVEDPVPELEQAEAIPEPEPEPEPEAEPEPVVEEPPEPEPTPAPPPEPAPQVAALPEEPEVLREPEPEPELEPEPVVEDPPEPEALPEPEPEAAPEPEQAQPAPPVPRRRPDVKIAEPEPEPEPEEAEDVMASILRNVEKLKPKSQPQSTQQAQAPTPASQRQRSRFEIDEIAREVTNQIAACWRLEPGARDAESLVVQIRVAMNPDGAVRRVEIVDGQRMLSDRPFRSAAENARRAVLNCSPLRLPLDKYDIWREIDMTFDPRQMFGG